MSKIFFLITFPFFLCCCSDNKEKELTKEIVLTVASKRETKNNAEETPSYYYVHYVKIEDSKVWIKFPYEILNFNYKEGFEYVIKVLEVSYENPPQDAPSKEYRFIELINKEEKESQNLLE